jgi:hypothetical protein
MAIPRELNEGVRFPVRERTRREPNAFFVSAIPPDGECHE